LAQRVGINEVAESIMAFNTNYKDTGLFGVYAVAKVSHCVDSKIHNSFVSRLQVDLNTSTMYLSTSQTNF